MTGQGCRDAAVPGHVCAGEVHPYISGRLCEASAPPRPAAPPWASTAAGLAARDGAVVSLLERAARLSRPEVDAINALAKGDVGEAWASAVYALIGELGWETAGLVDAALRAERDGVVTAHAAPYRAWRRGSAAGRAAHLHYGPGGLSVLGWTAAAVAARDVLRRDVYVGATSIWREVVGPAHPADVDAATGG